MKNTLFNIEGREKLYVKSIIKYLKLMNKYIFGIKCFDCCYLCFIPACLSPDSDLVDTPYIRDTSRHTCMHELEIPVL